MFLGHYGVALAAKRLAPKTSLGTLTFAAQWCDELWPILLLLNIERVRIVPGLMPANPLDFVSYPISHSLLAVIGWSALIGLIYWFARRYPRGALVVGLAVVSHWFLDLPMHRPDLPLWPNSNLKLGFGLWTSLPRSVALELMVLGAGVLIYTRATRPRDKIGTWAFWLMIAVLTGFYLASEMGPPPTNERNLAIGALGLWLFVPWAAWIDRHREVRIPTPAS
jgi:membrane-bound metal-dependent hydrolase YbcI (DUF457 family)